MQQPSALAPLGAVVRAAARRPATLAPATESRLELPRLTEGAVVAGVSSALYLALATILVLQLHLIVGDAWSRVGNAYYVFFSRDPHLAAMGFVWNPLPSMLEIPLVLARALWPPLVQQGFAGSIVSVLAMGGAVYQLYGILADWHVPREGRLTLAALFAVHPMILHYGANGDTEALFLLLLLITMRYLSRWLESQRLQPLVVACVALALAYWTRYETAVVAATVIGLVTLVTFRRSRGPWRERMSASVADGLVVGSPFAFAFSSWSLASWVIVGHPFEQFSSIYGTTSQLQTGPLFSGTSRDAFLLAVSAIRGLEPGLGIVVVLSVVLALWRRDARWLAPFSVAGSVLAFAVGAWVMGKTGGWIRYDIAVIPLATLCGGYLISRSPRSGTGKVPHRIAIYARRALVFALGIAAVVALAIAVPSAWATMRDPQLGRGEYNKVDDVPQYLIGGDVATYLDQLHLPAGSVLLDVFLGFPIVLQSDNPRQFVITPDRDFRPILADPQAFGVRYILVPPSDGLGTLDAVTRRWPGVYETGAGLGRLVREFGVSTGNTSLKWRLYKVIA